MRISIRIDSAAGNAQLRRWGGEFRAKVQKAVERAMRTEASEIKDDVRGHVAGQMSVVRKSFLKGFTAKVLAKDPKRLPALYVGSRIPWSAMHETGGQIAGRMLIPLHGRVGRKRFKAQVAFASCWPCFGPSSVRPATCQGCAVCPTVGRCVRESYRTSPANTTPGTVPACSGASGSSWRNCS